MKRLLVFLFCLCFWLFLSAQSESIALWDGTSVHAPKVTLEPFLPQANLFKGTAVIVCPGGSYSWLDYETEGRQVGLWLQQHGIAAFVLRYRVQGVFAYVTHCRAIFGGNQHPKMLQDVQRAMEYVRLNASTYGVNANKIGVMGFSAGGHLAMSAACFSHTHVIPTNGAGDVSLRPDFVVSIYPVVSMSHPTTHKRSRRALLGEWRKHKRRWRDSLSLEMHIPEDCPPVFLVNCKDDPTVKYRNSELLDSALRVHGVSHRYIQYKTGGHGFGASDTRGSEECRAWRDEFIKWLHKQL